MSNERPFSSSTLKGLPKHNRAKSYLRSGNGRSSKPTKALSCSNLLVYFWNLKLYIQTTSLTIICLVLLFLRSYCSLPSLSRTPKSNTQSHPKIHSSCIQAHIPASSRHLKRCIPNSSQFQPRSLPKPLKPHSLVVTSLPWPPVTYIIQGNVCPNTQSHIQEYFQFKNPIVTLIQSNVFMSIPPPEPTPCSLQLVYPSWLFPAWILTIAPPNPSIQSMNESFSCPQSSSN